MTKTLPCPGPPPHTFEHEQAGRGRPPKYCPEHRPAKPERKRPQAVTDVTDVTVVTDQSATDDAPVNPFIAKAKEKQRAQMEHARSSKTAKAKERTKQKTEDIENEYEQIEERIEQSTITYKKAFEAAKEVTYSIDTQSEFEKRWRMADDAQRNLLGALKRRRVLEALVEQLTDPNRKTLEEVAEVVVTQSGPDTVTISDPVIRSEPVWRNSVTDEELEMIDDAEYEEEETPPINDILSNPEQYDDPNDDIADSFLNAMGWED